MTLDSHPEDERTTFFETLGNNNKMAVPHPMRPESSAKPM